MSKKTDIYISTDIEANGPIPGVYSMLSLASAAYNKDGMLVDTFSINLDTLPDAVEHPDTKIWWESQKEAWIACRKNCTKPQVAMKKYYHWLINLSETPVFLGYPAAYDFMFVHWYLINFVGKSPFSHSALDIKSFAMGVMKKSFHQINKKVLYESLHTPPKNGHTHIAIDDAISQGDLFFAILKNIEN